MLPPRVRACVHARGRIEWPQASGEHSRRGRALWHPCSLFAPPPPSPTATVGSTRLGPPCWLVSGGKRQARVCPQKTSPHHSARLASLRACKAHLLAPDEGKSRQRAPGHPPAPRQHSDKRATHTRRRRTTARPVATSTRRARRKARGTGLVHCSRRHIRGAGSLRARRTQVRAGSKAWPCACPRPRPWPTNRPFQTRKAPSRRTERNGRICTDWRGARAAAAKHARQTAARQNKGGRARARARARARHQLLLCAAGCGSTRMCACRCCHRCSAASALLTSSGAARSASASACLAVIVTTSGSSRNQT